VVSTIIQEDLPGNAARVGKYFLDRLAVLKEQHRVVTGVRGKGLILGLEVSVPARTLVAGCLERGLLTLTAGDNVVRFVPPLIVTETEVDRAVRILEEVLNGLPQ
jgi:acetylornithine/succinyldiaminopimelate/putrescine aminotransferase